MSNATCRNGGDAAALLKTQQAYVKGGIKIAALLGMCTVPAEASS